MPKEVVGLIFFGKKGAFFWGGISLRENLPGPEGSEGSPIRFQFAWFGPSKGSPDQKKEGLGGKNLYRRENACKNGPFSCFCVPGTGKTAFWVDFWGPERVLYPKEIGREAKV